ncbi:hypothetical protein BJY16_002727 [Actinoplanes octamycinicus]|uniref:Uncharacterized protein n=1 Tax=Actinoplanes octamycinicus TaxID=135948 RepID=A0A7W7GVX6_9ACTN|nr:hypothetical protein [Actinoplanes octamycinicus]MBB4739268.1 hypothetical protein [Actinoplanes octamycinicus]
MLMNEPAPVAIWGALWLATVPAMVVLASPAKVRNPGRALAEAWAFLIGRPARPRAAAEAAAPLDFFATDAVSAEFAVEAAVSYRTVAAEEGAAFRYAVPAAPAAPLSAAAESVSVAVPLSSAAALSSVSFDSEETVPTNRVMGGAPVLNAAISAGVAASGSPVPGEASPGFRSAVPDGVAGFSDGVVGLSDGVVGLSDGVAGFSDGLADLSDGLLGSSDGLPGVAALSSRLPGGWAAPGAECTSGGWAPAGKRSPGRMELLRRIFRGSAARRADRLRAEAGAVRTVRYAEEVRVAAERAGYATDRWQEHWEAAAERVDAAFRAWQAADSRARRSRRAAAFGTPYTAQSPAEYADRERHLHLAVRAAAERGELPTSAVADALTGRGGWDARLHPVEQELVIQRASADHLEAVWQRAVEAEALAWRDSQAARRNWHSLCQEAILAAAHATAVRHLLPAEPVAVLVTGHHAPVARVA